MFDSRIDPIQAHDPKDIVPSISIYTDQDSGFGLSQNNGGPPFRRIITLNIWLTMGMQGENPDVETIVFPATDAQLEAKLDLFEHQVRHQFFWAIGNPWAVLMRKFFTRCTEWRSDRTASSDNIRLAARQITAIVEIKDDYEPEVLTAAPDIATLPPNVQALLDAVEAAGEPRGDVINMIGMLQTCGVPTSIVVPPLTGVTLHERHDWENPPDNLSVPDSPIAEIDLNP